MAKKVKGRELKEVVVEQDEVTSEEESSPVLAFFEKNRNALLIGGGALVVVILGVLGFNYFRGAKNTEAEAEMFHAVQYFEADSLRLALDGDGSYMGFLEVADNYPGTKAANLANYYIGVIYLQQGDTENGIEYLERFSTGDNMLSMAAYMALGFAWEDKDDPAKAADYFERAAYTPKENKETTPFMLMHAGRNYEAAGKPEKALKVYETIRDEYPLSQEGSAIDKYIGRVTK
ncbi:MAG: hypothetical protein EAZ89_05450 [Bacteroidetes bacterium]|nr:MAG: hypothetical protein EAZ89_05450 [Bacteroidota bacterium]